MKTLPILALVVLSASVLTFQVAQAQEHPGKTTRSTMSEQLGKVEHPAKGDLISVAAAAGDFKTLIAAIKAAGLEETLQGKGPFTVFAPTDAAFAKLPEGTLESLLEPANKAKLAGILASHVVPGKIMAADVKTMKAANVNGQDLDIQVKDGDVTVSGAKVIKTDVAASNGVIHVIDTVILTDAPARKSADAAKPKDHPAH